MGVGRQARNAARTLTEDDDLVLKSLCAMTTTDGREVAAAQCWAAFVAMVGSELESVQWNHTARARGETPVLLNRVLKVPAQLFVRKPEAVRAACHGAWRALVDCYARQFAPLGSVRRVRLLVKPLVAEISATNPNHHRLAVTPSTLAPAVDSWAALVHAAGGCLHTVAADLVLPVLRPPPLPANDKDVSIPT